VNTVGESYKILVIHQLAQRLLRKDICREMKKNIKELDNVDVDIFNEKVEVEADSIEKNYLKQFSDAIEEADRIPIFDFEVN
jgi:DNA-binding SARP family transcriptional activator